MNQTEPTNVLRCFYCERRFVTDHRDPRAEAHVNGWVVTAEVTVCPACANARAHTHTRAGCHPSEHLPAWSDHADLGSMTRTE